jgi:hypothetical protein
MRGSFGVLLAVERIRVARNAGIGLGMAAEEAAAVPLGKVNKTVPAYPAR